MKIVMLAGKGDSSKFVFNEIQKYYPIIKVLEEESPNKFNMIRNRVRRVGWINVIGQIMFLLFSKLLKVKSKNRIKKLIEDYELSKSPINERVLKHVTSVNSDEAIEELKHLDPDIVIVNGTRIISQKVLSSVRAKFINTHLGITPKYRGVHGGYWAIANNDMGNCGTTVHLVDKGIDTGGILYQGVIKIDSSDNYCTYPIHQVSIGIKLMLKALGDAEKNNLRIVENDLESKLWYHPEIWTYIKNYLLWKIK